MNLVFKQTACFFGILGALSCTQVPQDRNGSSQRNVSEAEQEDTTAASATLDTGEKGDVETLSAKITVRAGSFKAPVKVTLQEASKPAAAKSYTAVSRAQAITVANSSGSRVSEVAFPLEVSLKDLSSSGKDFWVLIVESDGKKGLVLKPKVSGSSVSFLIASTNFTAVAIEALSATPSDIDFLVDENGVKQPVAAQTTTYLLNVAVTGLGSGKSLVVQETVSSAEVTFSSSTTQAFTTPLTSGISYTVSVKTQPAGQTCTVISGSGTITAATIVSISCTVNTYALKVNLTGLSGGTVTIRESNTGISSDTVFTSNTTQTIATLAYSTSYSVSVQSQPSGQTCTVNSGTGTLTASTTVGVSCSTSTHTLSVSVTGLGTSKTAVIREAGLGASADLTFTNNTTQNFSTTLSYNATYSVSVQTQPSGQTCTVSAGSGTITSNTTISVSCEDVIYVVARNYGAGGTSEYSSCGLKNGAVKCWGSGSSGQLGNNSGSNSDRAVAVNSPINSDVASISAGLMRNCAVKTNGTAWCWGENGQGTLGDNTNTSRSVPVQVSGLTTVTKIYAGYNFWSCAILTDGEVKCWGYGAHSINYMSPQTPTGLESGVGGISLSEETICAYKAGGKIYCWGYGDHGAIGDGANTNRNTPTQVSNLNYVIGVASGSRYHSCAIEGASSSATYGKVYCWGFGQNGRLGNGSSSNTSAPANPVVMSGGGDLTHVTRIQNNGHEITCALRDTDSDGAGDIYCWGNSRYGSSAVKINNITNATQFALGYSGGCAVQENGAAKCWGDYRILGDGTGSEDYSNAHQVAGLTSGVKSLDVGLSYACAVHGGTIKCWGDNSYRQLGSGDGTTEHTTPVNVVDF